MALTVKLFHIASLGWYIFVMHRLTCTSDSETTNEKIKVMKKYTYLFLTNWTYGVQLVYFACCVLAHFMDIIPSFHKLRDKLNTFGNCLFTTIGTAMPFVVTIIFWAIYIIDRELIFPEWIDAYIPPLINHSIHSLNSVFPLIDICLVNHRFPSFSFGAKLITSYLLVYSIVIHWVYFQSGDWLYGFLYHLTWPQRGLLSILFYALALAIFVLIRLFSSLIWGSKPSRPSKSAKSKKNSKPKSKKAA